MCAASFCTTTTLTTCMPSCSAAEKVSAATAAADRAWRNYLLVVRRTPDFTQPFGINL